MTWMEWYETLWKPGWTPAPSTIGLIWQILYPIIIVTFGFVFVRAFRRKIPWIVALPFAINLLANLVFTPFSSDCGTCRWLQSIYWLSWEWLPG